MYYPTIVQIQKMLDRVLVWLDKAEAYADLRKFDAAVLLQSRLYPDMLPLLRQIQIITDNAKGIAGRLSGQAPPVIEDNETNIAELRARIARVKDYLASFSVADFADADDARCVLGSAPGRYLKGNQYFVQYGLPNLYFHLTTAYAILRHNGVPLGKNDYIGELPFHDL